MIIPDWFQKQLDRMRGTSIYGDPIIRVAWGPEQRDWRGRYKYLNPDGKPMERWILERWQPAGFFGSRVEWEKTASFYDDVHQEWVDIKGPFPTRGQYVMLCPITGNQGEYVPLDETVLRGIREKLCKDEEFASLRPSQRDEMIMAEHKRKEFLDQYEADKRQEDIREYWLNNWDRENRCGTSGYSISPR